VLDVIELIIQAQRKLPDYCVLSAPHRRAKPEESGTINRSLTIPQSDQRPGVSDQAPNAQVKALEGEISILNQTVKDREREVVKSRMETEELRKRVQAYQDENTKLHEMIHEINGQGGGPDDDEIVREYGNLCANVSKVAFSFYNNARPTKIGIYIFNGLSKSVIIARIRAVIYHCLKQDMFDKPRYGLNPDLEEGMIKFEEYMIGTNKCKYYFSLASPGS
jgi:hypothetical protein